MRLFIMGTNVADDAAICDLGFLGDFVPVYEKSSVIYLYVTEPLEMSSNNILHALDPFDFVGALDKVSVLLGLSCIRADDYISSPWF